MMRVGTSMRLVTFPKGPVSKVVGGVMGFGIAAAPLSLIGCHYNDPSAVVYINSGNVSASVVESGSHAKQLASTTPQGDDIIAQGEVAFANLTITEGVSYVEVDGVISCGDIPQGERKVCASAVEVTAELYPGMNADRVWLGSTTMNGEINAMYMGAYGAVGVNPADISESRVGLRYASTNGGGYLLMDTIAEEDAASDEVTYHDLDGNEIVVTETTDPNQVSELADPTPDCPTVVWIKDTTISNAWYADPKEEGNRLEVSEACPLWSWISPADDFPAVDTDGDGIPDDTDGDGEPNYELDDVTAMWEYNVKDDKTNNDEPIPPAIWMKIEADARSGSYPGGHQSRLYVVGVASKEE